MSVTAKDFLDSAIELSKSGQDEMTQRNVISRAYYAAYHRSCELIKPENSDDHVGFHKRYINQLMKGDNGSIERRIGGKIKSMYSRRLSADYWIKDSIGTHDVAIQINAAKDLFSITEAHEKADGAVDGGPPIRPARPSLKVVK